MDRNLEKRMVIVPSLNGNGQGHGRRIDDVLALLKCVIPNSTDDSQYMALCPAHADHNQSLAVKEGDSGNVVLHCFAGCTANGPEPVCEALGISVSYLFPDNDSEPVSKPTSRPESYVYCDAGNTPLFKIQRTEDKNFYPYVYDQDKGTFARRSGMQGVERVLYHLPELTHNTLETVFWVEGEKDVDRLRAEKLLATTAPGGAMAPLPDLSPLSGRDVVIIPDNDSTGRSYAERVGEALEGIASSVKWLELPDVPTKGDVSDYLNRGGSVEALLALEAVAPEFTPQNATSTTDDVGSQRVPSVELLSMGTEEEILEQEYLVKGLIPAGHPSMIFGDGGVGKSVLCLSMACALAAGLPDWLGFALKRTNVLYLDYEMPFTEQVRRARKVAHGLGLDKVPADLYYLEGSPEYSWAQLLKACIDSEIGLVIVDSFGPALAGDMEAANDIITYIRDFVKPLLNHGIAVHFIDHQPKAQGANYQDMTAFGSVYKRNLVRSQIQVEGSQDEEDVSKYRVIFRHKKHNFGPKLQPFGAELVFGGDDIRLRSLAIEPDVLMKEKDVKVDDRVLLALYGESGPLTKQDISERIGAASGSVSNALLALKKRGLTTDSDQRKGHQSLYEIMQQGVNKVEKELIGIASPNGWQDGGKGFID